MNNRLSLLATACVAFSLNAWGANHDPAAYPLRVHIFSFEGQAHAFIGSSMAWEDGSGRATLYENGDPSALDFKFKCQQRMHPSQGYETYMARWKKLDQVLEVLLPEGGKSDSTYTCELKTQKQEKMAYAQASNGHLLLLPATAFKQWMVAYQYDPEHGKTTPIVPASKAVKSP